MPTRSRAVKGTPVATIGPANTRTPRYPNHSMASSSRLSSRFVQCASATIALDISILDALLSLLSAFGPFCNRSVLSPIIGWLIIDQPSPSTRYGSLAVPEQDNSDYCDVPQQSHP